MTTDQTIIISASHDKTIKIWQKDFQKREIKFNLIQTLQGHTKQVNSVSVSGDGSVIASASDDKTIKIWLKATTAEQGAGKAKIHYNLSQTLEGHTNSVNTVYFTPDGKMLLSGSSDTKVLVWKRVGAAGQPDIKYTHNQILSAHYRTVHGVHATPDGATIVSCAADNTVRVWVGTKAENEGDFYAYAIKRTLEHHASAVKSVSISANGYIIASGSTDRTVMIWTRPPKIETEEVDIGNYTIHQTLDGHTNSVMTVAITPDGSKVISGAGDSTLKIWTRTEPLDKISYALNQTLKEHSNFVNSLVISEKLGFVVSGSSDNTLRIWTGSGFQGKFARRAPSGRSKNISCCICC